MSQPFGCVNNTIRLRSGHYLDLADPKPDQFEFSDIAGGLSKICRFGGQIGRFYSVAEHSYWCAITAGEDGWPQDAQVAVLMHDAAEAFIGDIVKPLKIMLGNYSEIEENLERVIGEKFGIDWKEHSAAIKGIDHAMLIAERNRLFSRDSCQWSGEDRVRALRVDIQCWGPEYAEMMFVQRARELGISIGSSGAKVLA